MSFNAWGRAASDEVSWHNQPGKNKGLLESLTKCKKRNLAIYPVILTTSRLVTNAYLKGIMMDIKTVVTPLNISLSFSQPVSLVIPAEAQWFLIKTWYLQNLLSESGVPNGKKNNAISSRVSTWRGQKNPFICIIYMVGLNDAGSFLVMKLFKRTSNGDFRSKWLGIIAFLWPFLTVSVHYSSCRSKLWLWKGLEAKWSENKLQTTAIT